jgi:hypothetical protein
MHTARIAANCAGFEDAVACSQPVVMRRSVTVDSARPADLDITLER